MNINEVSVFICVIATVYLKALASDAVGIWQQLSSCERDALGFYFHHQNRGGHNFFPLIPIVDFGKILS